MVVWKSTLFITFIVFICQKFKTLPLENESIYGFSTDTHHIHFRHYDFIDIMITWYHCR